MSKQSPFGEKIRIIRKSKNLTMEAFGEIIGVTKGTISLWESGKNIPPKTTMSLIDKLFGGGDTPPAYSKKEERPLIREEPADYRETDFVPIPMVSGKISAGGGLVPDIAVELRIAFRKDWIQRHGDPQNMSLIHVSGDSMEPTLYSGDIVLVDHNRNYIDPQGGIYAVAMNDIIMIKRVQVDYTSKRVYIISDNPKYKPLEANSEQVVINGKVIWFGREIER